MWPWKVFSRDIWSSLQVSLIRIWIFLCLAGRGFVPGVTMVNIFTLVCCLKSKSIVGVEGESFYFSFLHGNGKRPFPGPQVHSKPALLSDPSDLDYPLMQDESAPGVQGVHLDCESSGGMAGEVGTEMRSRTQFFQCLRKWSKHYTLSIKEGCCQLLILSCTGRDSGAYLFLGQPFELVCLNYSSWFFYFLFRYLNCP